MSLVTTCPECQIRFIVRPEHLSAHGGKVRCGKCNHVFNAIEHLQEPNAVEVPVGSSSATSMQVESIPPSYVDAIEETPIEFPFKSSEITVEEVVEERTIATEALELSFDVDTDIAQETRLDDAPTTNETPAEPDQTDEPSSSEPLVKPVLKLESAIAEALKPVSISLDNEHKPSVVDTASSIDEVLPPLEPIPSKRKREKVLGATRSYTWLWALFSLLLIAAAAGQTAYFMRSRLAVLLPPIKPYMELACGYAHCTIPLPKDMQLLVIDDSDLHEDAEHDGILHLTSTLINNAPYAQAYPNIELSLTNENDTPVLRRIFTPAEYLEPQVNPANGILGGDETHINLALHVADTVVSGYRVYLTYH